MLKNPLDGGAGGKRVKTNEEEDIIPTIIRKPSVKSDDIEIVVLVNSKVEL